MIRGLYFSNESISESIESIDILIYSYISLSTTQRKPPIISILPFSIRALLLHSLGFYLDGKVDAIVGTHTHVPTCDQMVLPKGTLYITDVGMCGAVDSSLGVKAEITIRMFLTARNQRFEWESAGRRAFRSVLLDTEANSIERIDKLI